MQRKIIQIDEEKCTGCGLCADACHEGAIGMVDGKARLLRDDYCDALGDCLPACPADAISFTVREAAPYDEAAVAQARSARSSAKAEMAASAGATGVRGSAGAAGASGDAKTATVDELPADTASALAQWPCQIRLVPPRAPYFDAADLLIAADCTAFACGDFHARFMEGRITVNGCPKLDPVDYSEKLAQILAENDIRSVTVVLMEVPCCGGLGYAVERALETCGKDIPARTVIVSTDGRILD